MTIDLISVWQKQLGRGKSGQPSVGLSPDEIIKIINGSKADIIVFPGWTINNQNVTASFQESIRNKTALITLEVVMPGKDLTTNRPAVIRNGYLRLLRNSQQFSSSSEVNNDPSLISSFINVFNEERVYAHYGKQVGLVVCGENNILKNKQSEGNKVIVRTNNAKEAEELKRSLRQLDIVINYTHTQQTGHQGKFHKRREYFSAGGRVYCMTTNFTSTESKQEKKYKSSKTLQYCYIDGAAIEGELNEQTSKYMIKRYHIA